MSSASPFVRIVAENLTDEARVIAPAEGRRREVEVETGVVRRWLENFSALPALDAEDAGARLHLSTPAHRLVVRWTGGHLGTDERGTFVAATVEEILANLLAGPEPVAARGEVVDSETPAPARRKPRAQGWLLAGLLLVFVPLAWWSLQSETPDGVEWVRDGAEGQAILAQTAGGYASDNERITLTAAASLVANNGEGQETLRTSVRVGRRAGLPVLVTETGVVLEVMADGTLRLGESVYRRVR